MAWIVIGERTGEWPDRVSVRLKTMAEAHTTIAEAKSADRQLAHLGTKKPASYRVVNEAEYERIALDRPDIEAIDFEGEAITVPQIFDAMNEEPQVQESSLSDDYKFSWTGVIEPVGRVKVVWTFVDGAWFVNQDAFDDLPWGNASYVTISRP